MSSKREGALRVMGKQRDIALSLPHILPILNIVACTTYIASVSMCLGPATAPQSIEERIKRYVALYPKLDFQPLPFKVDSIYLSALWHERTDKDPGLQWLRK